MLYKGEFNWYNEVHTLYRHAKSKQHAFILMTRAISLALDISGYKVRNHFYNQNNYKIIIVGERTNNNNAEHTQSNQNENLVKERYIPMQCTFSWGGSSNEG